MLSAAGTEHRLLFLARSRRGALNAATSVCSANPPHCLQQRRADGGSESSSGDIAPNHSQKPISQKHPELMLVVSSVLRDGKAEVALLPSREAAQVEASPPGMSPVPTEPIVVHRGPILRLPLTWGSLTTG